MDGPQISRAECNTFGGSASCRIMLKSSRTAESSAIEPRGSSLHPVEMDVENGIAESREIAIESIVPTRT